MVAIPRLLVLIWRLLQLKPMRISIRFYGNVESLQGDHPSYFSQDSSLDHYQEDQSFCGPKYSYLEATPTQARTKRG